MVWKCFSCWSFICRAIFHKPPSQPARGICFSLLTKIYQSTSYFLTPVADTIPILSLINWEVLGSAWHIRRVHKKTAINIIKTRIFIFSAYFSWVFIEKTSYSALPLLYLTFVILNCFSVLFSKRKSDLQSANKEREIKTFSVKASRKSNSVP